MGEGPHLHLRSVCAIAVMAKASIAGKTKTRLVPPLTEDEAATLTRAEALGLSVVRVAAAGLRVVEIPVGQRRRAGGVSKVSGNWRSAALAAWVLAQSFRRLAWRLRQKDPVS